MVSAMVKAGSAEPAKYLPELAKINHKGVTGTIAFDNKGDIKNGALTLYTYKAATASSSRSCAERCGVRGRGALRAPFSRAPDLSRATKTAMGGSLCCSSSGRRYGGGPYFSFTSLYSTCLRALGSNFRNSSFSGVVFLFLFVV